ncbi:Resolvase, Holliday junction-type [Methanococcus aeolicus Nankai-3]|uniref:Crossover junction endodeoxyribonuclease Hjc n=1 Tax=Methanococcus aeolicus (strain ATCC BAA-1280 / DSM 17508 / OCM 812 / Nankai-3) TaxID=419665 RepID=A6UUM9_META3|nr:Holliday junction resolvase Hjc [Methanococcus aeolicus]ABR56201.1 Resolvase, Holliday junction-type [Methanococcus aeolicus Nankai-3]
MKRQLYIKGSNFERELKKLFENKGFAVIRSAGSHGVDIVAGKKGKIYAFECKATSNEKFYISNNDVDKLINFSELFGAIPYIALKVKLPGELQRKSDKKILFINPYLLVSSGKNYSLDYHKIYPISEKIEDLL